MKKRRIRAKLPYPLNVQDPDLLFDLICLQFYLAGAFGKVSPIEQGRKGFSEIKRMLKYYEANK